MEEELKERIKKMYEDGKTIREIAKELNISYAKVRKILISEGVKLRGRLRQELVNKIIELAKQGYSANRISKEMGLNSNTVLRILRKNNLVKTKRRLSKEDIERIKTMYESGTSIYKIAKELKISTNLVVYHLKKLNIYKPQTYS